MKKETVALDSQRSIDESGHLRIARTVLSKAAVNPYFGREIPDYEELGLDPDKVYRLLRDPEALQDGADTFKGKQFLIKHEYVDAEDVKKDLIIGSIGTRVYYEDGILYGDLTAWDASAIELIETKKMDELSASYWYKAVMKSGVYNGEEYDGIMTNIHGNHVALVTRGRIGRDAIISDSLPLELEFNMKLKKGAKQRITEKLRAIAQDGIASDSAEELIREVAENIEHKPAFDTEKLRELAGDNYDEIVKLIGGEAETSGDGVPKAPEAPKVPEGGEKKPADDEDEGLKAEAERKKLEETDRDDRDAKREAAMDADAIASAVQAKIEAKYRARDKVEQLVGRIAIDGFKDASEIYAFALKQKGIACDGVNEAGLAQLVNMAANNRKTATVAQDADAFEPSALTSRFRKA